MGGIDPALLIAALLTASVPILLAAVGELVVERAGVLNLGVEGMMIIGAICGFITAVETGSPLAGFIGGAVGGAVLSLYPPVGEGDLNEQGLTALCSAGDFDVLITGDMAGSTERKLVGQYDLPDIEVLMVGHHGSRYSSSQELLQAVRPETAIISVGDNSYGHPTQEAMDRLSQAGAEIYRTDRQGNILVTVHGGD